MRTGVSTCGSGYTWRRPSWYGSGPGRLTTEEERGEDEPSGPVGSGFGTGVRFGLPTASRFFVAIFRAVLGVRSVCLHVCLESLCCAEGAGRHPILARQS